MLERNRMATFNDVWKIGMGLPEVEETTFYGTAGLKLKVKHFVESGANANTNEMK